MSESGAHKPKDKDEEGESSTVSSDVSIPIPNGNGSDEGDVSRRVKASISALKSDDTGIVVSALITLCTSLSEASARSVLAKDASLFGTLSQLLLSAAQIHGDSCLVQRGYLSVVKCLSASLAPRRGTRFLSLFVRAGGTRGVLSTLKTYSHDICVASTGLSVLTDLINRQKKVAAVVRLEGGIPVLVECLSALSSQLHAAPSEIDNLIREDLASKGALPGPDEAPFLLSGVPSLEKAQGAREEAVTACLYAIVAAAKSSNGATGLVKNRACSGIVIALTIFLRVKDVVHAALRAMLALLRNAPKGASESIISASGVASITAAGEIHRGEVSVIKTALLVFKHLKGLVASVEDNGGGSSGNSSGEGVKEEVEEGVGVGERDTEKEREREQRSISLELLFNIMDQHRDHFDVLKLAGSLIARLRRITAPSLLPLSTSISFDWSGKCVSVSSASATTTTATSGTGISSGGSKDQLIRSISQNSEDDSGAASASSSGSSGTSGIRPARGRPASAGALGKGASRAGIASKRASAAQNMGVNVSVAGSGRASTGIVGRTIVPSVPVTAPAASTAQGAPLWPSLSEFDRTLSAPIFHSPVTPQHSQYDVIHNIDEGVVRRNRGRVWTFPELPEMEGSVSQSGYVNGSEDVREAKSVGTGSYTCVPVSLALNVAGEDGEIVVESAEAMRSEILDANSKVRAAKEFVVPPPFDFAMASISPLPCDELYCRRSDEKLWYAATSPPFNHGAPLFSINGDYEETGSRSGSSAPSFSDRSPNDGSGSVESPLRDKEKSAPYQQPHTLVFTLMLRDLENVTQNPNLLDLSNPERMVYDSEWSVDEFESRKFWRPCLPDSSCWDPGDRCPQTTSTSASSVSVPAELCFESRFECGNLRRALRTGPSSYDLVLNTDINTQRHVQWFCFAITGAETNVPYRFCIVNLEKTNSQFNGGMRPLCFSVRDRGWRRVGDNIAYYPNQHPKSEESASQTQKERMGKGKNADFATFFTLSFTIEFPNGPGDVYCIAFHYPYTYSSLQRYLGGLQSNNLLDRCHRQVLCETLTGNRVDLLTITDLTVSQSSPASTTPSRSDSTTDAVNEKEKGSLLPMPILPQRSAVVLSARVHPGETNSSWIMKGIIDFLIGNTQTAKELRSRLVFKIIPMLNPDGVVNGNHRTNLTGHDLNREWQCPSASLSPTIYHSRALLHYLSSPHYPHSLLLFCDFHGHSLRKHAFIYGCADDDDESTYMMERVFPYLLSKRAGNLFSWNLSNFKVQASKSKSARVSLYKDLGLINCYTLESTYMGTEKELVDRRGLERLGQSFCETLLLFTDPVVWRTVLGQLRGAEGTKAGIPRMFDESSSESESSDDDRDDSLQRVSVSTSSSSSRKVKKKVVKRGKPPLRKK